MAFRDHPNQKQGVELLQRSLDRGRLAHAYLFSGDDIQELESLAGTLARTLNCLDPVRGPSGAAIDSCDVCLNCRKIQNSNHADVHWIRPESKSRVIVIDQMRALMQDMNLKPTEAEYKLGIVSGADRLNVQAANAFLKTLEEPPAKSILVLLTTDSQRILETILSRCLRLSFGGQQSRSLPPEHQEWVEEFGRLAAAGHQKLLSRYRVLDVLLQQLGTLRENIDATLTARSPLQKYEELEKNLRDKWEDELTAAIEAEYRRQRASLLLILQSWFRDVWVLSLRAREGEGAFHEDFLWLPDVSATREIARRITPEEAVRNLEVLEELQRLLSTNVQEALALEVGLLKLHL